MVVTEQEAKYWQDKHILETKGHKLNDGTPEARSTAIAIGITPENFDRIQKEKYGELGDPKFAMVRNEFLREIKSKNQGAASEVLAQFVQEELQIYTTKDDIKPEIWVYKEGIYIPNGRSEIRELLRKVLDEFYSIYYVNMAMAKIEADTFIDPEKFFKNYYKTEIPLGNGILNIISLELKPFSKDKIFFNKLPITYDPEIECPKIEKFLDSVFANDNDKKVFYELGGFCLLKEYKFEKAFMFVGDGRNGKDKTLELLKRTIGLQNCCSVPLSCLDADSFRIGELLGKMANIAGDIGNTDLKDTSMFKACTGRSIISAKRKFLNEILFENYSKFIFACNDLPMVYDLSRGFWDRWVLFEFPFTFVTKEELERDKDNKYLKLRDEDIIDKITSPNELSGLLNRFLEGLHRLLLNRDFTSSKGTEEVKNTWIRKANSFIAFCMDKIEEDFEGKISKKEIRREYSKFCKEHKAPGKSDIVIKRVLQEQYGASEEQMNPYSVDQYQNYKGERFWTGIRWK